MFLMGAEPESLAAQIDKRCSFRGAFAASSAAQVAALDACIGSHADAAVPIDESLRKDVAGWYDEAAAEGLRNDEVARELYRFMRFTRRDKRWALDGLAADCMQLSRLEAIGASLLMRPKMLALLGRLGLLGMLVSEKPKVLSATRLVVIHARICGFATLMRDVAGIASGWRSARRVFPVYPCPLGGFTSLQ